MNNFKNSAFARFFTKFPQLFIAGLMFSVPLAAFTAAFVLIGRLLGFDNILIWGLGIIPAFPMYAGLVTVVRKIAAEKKDIKLFETFFSAVKDNFLLFLLHGVVMYLITACSFFALLYYYSLAKTDIVFGYILTIYIIVSLLMLVMMFYVPIMTVTYDLRIRDIYKNSFLLIFGKILRNVAALALVIAITVIAVILISGLGKAWLFVGLGIAVALYPMIYCYIINSIISKGLQDTVGLFNPPVEEEEEQADEQAALENADTNSDYVFVNGKMIKRQSDNKE